MKQRPPDNGVVWEMGINNHKVCWRVTQQGAVPIVTINPSAPFISTADPSIPMRGVGTIVILKASMPIFVIASADKIFIKLSSSTSVLWTLCPSMIVEITKASSCGYLIPCPSAGVNVMGSCQDLSWPIATRTWSLNLVLLLLVMPTLVDKPPSMTRTSRSAGPYCLTSPPSPSRDGSFFKNCLKYLCAKSLSTFFLRA